MKRSILSAVLVSVALAVAARPASPAPAPSDLLKSLPAGDLILTVNVDSLVNRSVPAWFGSDPETAARVEERLTKARIETGIDPRKVRELALSMRLEGAAGADFAAILTGSFDPARILEALKASKGGAGARSETYNGVTVQSFSATLAAPGAPAGATDLAYAILDPETLLVGSLASVRAALDARAGRAPHALANAELLAAYEETGSAAAGRFAMLMPAETIKAELAKDPGNIALQNFALVRTVFGTLDTSAGASLRATSRTRSADDARTVSGALLSLKDLGRLLVGNTPALADLVNRVAVTTQGTDAVVTLELPASLVPAVFNSLQKPAPPKPIA